MVSPSVPYNNINWHTNFLVIFISMSVDIFTKDIRTVLMSHIALYFMLRMLGSNTELGR